MKMPDCFGKRYSSTQIVCDCCAVRDECKKTLTDKHPGKTLAVARLAEAVKESN